MDGSIALGRRERKALLEVCRGHPAPAVRKRAQIVLLLADGYAWSLIAAVLFCSTRTVDRWKRRYEQGGIDALVDDPRGRRSRFGPWLIPIVVSWVTDRAPGDFGFLRTRWCCGVVVVLLVELHHVKVSPETVRRWLHQEHLVWRRPRPVLGPKDPQREQKLRKLRDLLANLSPDEIAVFQDEVVSEGKQNTELVRCPAGDERGSW